MKKIITVCVLVVSFVTAHSVFAKGHSDSASFAQTLPKFSLQDPDGKTFVSDSLSKDGLVLVVTAPILKNESAQQGWSQYLVNAKTDSKAKLVFLEDMQPSSFKSKAKSIMKEDSEPGKEPILLIDNGGGIRRALNVTQKKTVVLVYDRDGKLVYSDTHKPSALAAETIWKKLKD